MTAIGKNFYAIGDSGTDDRVAVLDADCRLQRWIPVPTEPYDIEDVAAHGGRLWLSDTGDNLRSRQTVALTRMDPRTGAGEPHRLGYPDGRHDAEALLIEPGGRPVIVTKEFSRPAGVYVPAQATTVDDLTGPGPSELRRVGELTLGALASTGAPAPTEMVTGGTVSADGTVAAIRTYSSVYLYPVTSGDIVGALARATPIVVPVTGQPQGESVTFTESGDLLVGSETGGDGKPFVPLQILRGATGLFAPPQSAPTASDDGGSWWPVLGGAAVVLVVVGAGIWLLRRRR